MKLNIVVLAVVTLLCGISKANADEIRVATGYTFIKRVFDPIRSAFRHKTGIDIKILYNDPVPALAELEKGTVDVAGASLTSEDWLALATKAGVPVQERSRYTAYVPATEKTLIVVHAENRVQSLSKEQLKAIFTGKTTNWREVGGADAPILVVWPTVPSGAVIVVKAKIMDNEPLTKTVFDVESMADIPDAIAATPEAIGIVTDMKAGKGLKEVAPAIERPLTLLYKGTPNPSLQKLLEFLKSEGEQYIQ